MTIEFTPQESRSWTLQQILDRAVNHMIQQGCKSMRAGTCLYRLHKDDDSVLMCAAGPFIPDSQLSRVGNHIVCLAHDNNEYSYDFWIEYYLPEQLALLKLLQSIHDNYSFFINSSWKKYWRINVTSILRSFPSLTMPEVLM